MWNKWFLILSLGIFYAWAVPNKSPLSSSPLILDHSDQMNASKTSGIFELVGQVAMHHDDMKLSCDRALWNTGAGTLDAQGHLRMIHPEAKLSGDSGRYEKIPALAQIWGNASYNTADQKFWLSGDRMVYRRLEKKVEVQNQATLTEIPKEKNKNPDTLWITSDRMLYNDSLKIAYAWGKVKVRQGALRLKCDSLRYERKDSSLWLMGNAYGKYKGWKSTARIMHSIGGGKKLRLLEGFGLAVGLALQDTTGKDTVRVKNRLSGDTLRAFFVDGKISEVKASLGAQGAEYRDSLVSTADSLRSLIEGPFLWAKFKNGKMQEILSYPSALGTFFGDQKSELPSKSSGDTLKLRFKDGKADSAWISGHAKSTYHYYKNTELQGRNETQGETMTLSFKKGKVKIVDVWGELAKGTWFGFPTRKSLADSNSQSQDLSPNSAPSDTLKRANPPAKTLK